MKGQRGPRDEALARAPTRISATADVELADLEFGFKRLRRNRDWALILMGHGAGRGAATEHEGGREKARER